MNHHEIERVVEGGDLDELVRAIDHLCDERDWDGLVELRDRCRRALERGKQLWPAAALAEYRLALEAPGRWAGAVLVEGAGRFALGPLPEVAASTHTWDELAPHVPPGPLRTIAAHERIVRGEDLTGDDTLDADLLDTPLRLADWEPEYPVATYRPDKADFPSPDLPPLRPVRLPTPGARRSDPDVCDALLDLVRTWTAESNGRAEAVAVEGDALAAVAALGVPRARTAELTPDDAMAVMAWAGASGGAHGRRRGMATGRSGAYWVLEQLGGEHARLRWFAWNADEPALGWELRLAVADPGRGVAWALAAGDAS